jgi:hypothetical protein
MPRNDPTLLSFGGSYLVRSLASQAVEGVPYLRGSPWEEAVDFALISRSGSGEWRIGVTVLKEVGEESLVKLDLVRVLLASG